MTRSRSELSTGGAVLSTAASAELDGAGGATTKSRSMAAISRSNTSAKSSSEVFDDPADAAGGGTGWTGEAVGGFELVVACGVGLTGGCFPKASSTSIGKRNAPCVGSSAEFSTADVGFPHHRGHQRRNHHLQ